MMADMYEPCSFCGGEVVDAEPDFIPIGDGEVLKITNQICKYCGAVILGPYQRTEIIKNKAAHD